jgi:hypothetical protein
MYLYLNRKKLMYSRPLLRPVICEIMWRIHLANVELPNAKLPNAELVNAELPNAELLNVESY